MNKEFLKMQKIAGLITESELKGKMNENQNDFKIVGQIISQTPYEVTDYESLQDAIENTDLVDAVADEMGGDFTKARQALEAWGMKKFGEKMVSFSQEIYMDFLNDLFNALGNDADAYSESTYTEKEKALARAIYQVLEDAGIDLV